jgi:cytochrome c-type biogenesis protein
MDTSLSIGFGIAFSAGLLSFLSPCVLPLVPSYVTFITGLSLDDVQRSRRAALIHALLFILGFSLIFIALGATATLLGRILLTYREWITRIGGALVIVFGLYMLGVFNSGMLSRERRVHLADKPLGYLGTVLVGIAFGAGWTPCIGPILGSILAYSTSQADVREGVGLLAAYSMGLAVPFFLAAVAVERFLGVFGWLKRHMAMVNRIAGILLIAVGILMISDYFTIMAAKLQSLTPEAIRSRI